MNQRNESIRWYAAGLAFECKRCGRCCAGPHEGYVWVTRNQVAAIAAHLGMSDKQMYARYIRKVRGRFSLKERPGSRDCVFLQEASETQQHCAIYPVRPTQCRTWPFWQSNLSSPDSWSLAGVRCPGINHGKVTPLDQIEAQRNATRE